MSFYRIYRPQIIDEIDNLAVRGNLLQLLNKSKKDLPHAYLFSGPRGAGKTTAARLIAKLFNCQKLTKSGPCGTCPQCATIAEGRNLDVLEIDAASNRGIDEIRQLRDAINLAPSSAPYRVYIIDEVHMLTTEAFNALLKTLEEPPAHAVFILATTDAQKVPVTIKSRCISLIFAKASVSELVSALARIVKKEKIDIDTAGLQLIAESVDGSFRDAVKLLEQATFHKGAITQTTIRAMLSLATTQDIALFNEFFLNKQAVPALDLIHKAVDMGADMKIFVTQSLQNFEATLMLQVKGEALEKALNPTHAIRVLSRAFVEMRGSAIPQLPLELAVVEYCQNSEDAQPYRAKDEKPERSSAASQPPVGVPVKEQMVQADVSNEDLQPASVGTLTVEKLVEHWPDIITELKPYNHSVAGVMRSTRPKGVKGGIVTIEAFYTFHKDKLSESKTKDVLSEVLKKLFGEKVKVEVVLGKK